MTAYANLGMRRQPMPRPATFDEYLRIRPQMIDTTGQPLVLTSCESCKRQHFTVEPCAVEAPCPRCGSAAGRCRRPSGHNAASWHTERVVVFEELCNAREAAGLPQVARWPEPTRPPTALTLFEWGQL